MINRTNIEKVWMDNTHLYIRTTTGQTATCAFAEWSRLANATQQQREAYTLSYFGIHWNELDEDLSYEGLLYGVIGGNYL